MAGRIVWQGYPCIPPNAVAWFVVLLARLASDDTWPLRFGLQHWRPPPLLALFAGVRIQVLGCRLRLSL